MDRGTFGVEAVLNPRRRTDWTEPPAEEGGWQLPYIEKMPGEDSILG